MDNKYKIYYEIVSANYKELYDIYSNLIEKASKLLTFITIISGGMFFLLNWLFENYSNLGPNYGYIITITVILLFLLFIELYLILYAMFVKKLEKVRIKPADENFFTANNIDAVYYAIAKRYNETNEKNVSSIAIKSRSLGRAQKGLSVYIFLLFLGIILIIYFIN